MLVVLGIIAVLLALMLPALSKARRAGRNLKCVANMRQVSEKFIIFADDFAVETRGNVYPFDRSTFYLETFQESIYQINDFWDAASDRPGESAADVPRRAVRSQAARQRRVQRRRDLPETQRQRRVQSQTASTERWQLSETPQQPHPQLSECAAGHGCRRRRAQCAVRSVLFRPAARRRRRIRKRRALDSIPAP